MHAPSRSRRRSSLFRCRYPAQRRPRLKGATPFVLTVAVAACTGDTAELAHVVVTDSAGVEIVSSQRQTWPEGAEWRVGPEPALRIGSLDGAPEVTFGNVRDVGVLSDGRLYVADELAHTIRVFSAEGSYLESVGREGNGPGELTYFLTVAPYRADSLWVYDYAVGAVSVFAPDFSFGRRFTNPLMPENYWIGSALSGGRFLASSPGSGGVRMEGPGQRPDSSKIIVFSPDGTSADTVGAFLVRTQHFGDGGRPLASHLTPFTGIIGHGESVFFTDGATFSIREYDLEGTLRRVMRRSFPLQPVTPDMIADFQADYLERAAGHGGVPIERLREGLDLAHYGATLPSNSPVMEVDALGNLWVGHWVTPGDEITRWSVFDLDGRWLGEVDTPAGLDVKQITGDAVIGVATDELDVQYVQVHRLEKR